MITIRCEETGESQQFEGALTVGRHPDCDLVVPHRKVSSRHATLECRAGVWSLRDLGSSNGTSVNGRRIKGWQSLAAGDLLRFAGLTYRVEALDQGPDGPHSTRKERRASLDEPAEYSLVLRWTGPAEGVVEVHHQGQTWQAEAGMSFVLLDLLAEHPGEWREDEELRVRLWGRQGRTMSRSALSTLVYNTRRLFADWGLDDHCVQKSRGRTRLAVAGVERIPQ